MNLSERISKRFAELEAQASNIRTNEDTRRTHLIDSHQWATSALGLISGVFNEAGPHFLNFKKAYTEFSNSGIYTSDLDAMKGIFQAAKADYEAGFIAQVSTLISGEVFGDLVVLSKKALDEGFKDVAAVLACAALEDALKRFAILKGLAVDGKDMSEVIGALKSKGLVQGAQKTLLDSMPRIRNHALHAEWEKLSPTDVAAVIAFVERFLLEHFS